MSGFLHSPRQAFGRSPGILFLSIVLLAPLFFALASGKPFHARYCLVLLAPLLCLAGAGAQHWLGFVRARRFFVPAAAITTLAQQIELPLINLLPAFEQHAEAGRLLYSPFDTHWNGAGIQAAAEYIWQALQPLLTTVPRAPHPE